MRYSDRGMPVVEALRETGLEHIPTTSTHNVPNEDEWRIDWLGDHNYLQQVRTPFSLVASDDFDASEKKARAKALAEHWFEIGEACLFGRRQPPIQEPGRFPLGFCGGLLPDTGALWDLARVRLAVTSEPFLRRVDWYHPTWEYATFFTLIHVDERDEAARDRLCEALWEWWRRTPYTYSQDQVKEWRKLINRFPRGVTTNA